MVQPEPALTHKCLERPEIGCGQDESGGASPGPPGTADRGGGKAAEREYDLANGLYLVIRPDFRAHPVDLASKPPLNDKAVLIETEETVNGLCR